MLQWPPLHEELPALQELYRHLLARARPEKDRYVMGHLHGPQRWRLKEASRHRRQAPLRGFDALTYFLQAWRVLLDF